MEGLHESYACHNCRKGIGAHCVECKRVEGDELRIRSNKRSILRSIAAPSAAAERLTDLPPIAEDALLDFIHALTNLDPIGVLLTHHIARGGTTANFPHYMASIGETLSHAPDISRQTLHQKWGRIVRTFAPLERLAAWKRRGKARHPATSGNCSTSPLTPSTPTAAEC